MPSALGLLAALGAAAALMAAYWDDSWHTDTGRDDATIPPHLLLFGGVAVASLAVAAWGASTWRQHGLGVRGAVLALRDPAVRLAGLGGLVTLLSAPVDAAWHAAFGRDSVLWSPPHLTAVAGTLALSVGLLAGLRTSTGRGAGAARLAAGAGVLGALQVLVLEYDSDVPQFSTALYLPVATVALCAAVAVLDDLLPGRWAPTGAAAVYTGLRLLVLLLLQAAGSSLTIVPPVLPLLVVAGLLSRRPLALRLVVVGALVPLVWWPALQLQAAVTTVVAGDQLPAAVLLGAVGGLLVAVLHGDLSLGSVTGPGRALAVVLVAGGLMLALPPAPASAHDPGQGAARTQGLLAVTRDGDDAALRLALDRSCAGLTPVRTTARRAGQERQGPLRAQDEAGACTLTGDVGGLAPGRWFVYAEVVDSDGTRLEAWLAAPQTGTSSDRRPLYAPAFSASTAVRDISGAGLLAVVAVLLLACLRLARRAGRPHMSAGSSSLCRRRR